MYVLICLPAICIAYVDNSLFSNEVTYCNNIWEDNSLFRPPYCYFMTTMYINYSKYILNLRPVNEFYIIKRSCLTSFYVESTDCFPIFQIVSTVCPNENEKKCLTFHTVSWVHLSIQCGKLSWSFWYATHVKQ